MFTQQFLDAVSKGDILLLFLFLGGVMAGFINVVAAGGSSISLPILITLGLPAHVANATNRVAILLQNIASVSTYLKREQLDLKVSGLLAIPCVLGGMVGSYLASKMNAQMMEKAIGVVLLLMLFSLFLQPSKWIKNKPQKRTKRIFLIEFIGYFLTGVYGGFIQVGVGVFLLATSVLISGFDLKKANPIKVFLALSYTVVALIIFSSASLVWWGYGLILGLGNMLGGWLGAHASIKGGAKFIRFFLIGAVAFFAFKYLGIFNF